MASMRARLTKMSRSVYIRFSFADAFLTTCSCCCPSGCAPIPSGSAPPRGPALPPPLEVFQRDTPRVPPALRERWAWQVVALAPSESGRCDGFTRLGDGSCQLTLVGARSDFPPPRALESPLRHCGDTVKMLAHGKGTVSALQCPLTPSPIYYRVMKASGAELFCFARPL